MYKDFKLLVDGRNAFPEIIKAIENASESVYINMFIWRDDSIGNRMAKAVLCAADRGAKVKISVDRYGMVLEKAEESMSSFFHRAPSAVERIKIGSLRIFYRLGKNKNPKKKTENPLYLKIMAHPNIEVSKKEFKADHSKYYIIDGETLFLGGINIEDKENGADMQGRVYQDYMVKMIGKDHVASFLKKLNTGENDSEKYFFGVNIKKPFRSFEMEKLYLDMIRSAQKDLFITMAYFSPLPSFVNAIVDAYKRGVKVTVMIPERANFQNDTNRLTVRKLLKRTNNGITVYMSPKMLHTKLVVSDDLVSFGSTNITKKAFNQLSELNLFVKNTGSEFTDELFGSMKENYSIAKKVSDYREIRYSPIIAAIEGVLV